MQHRCAADQDLHARFAAHARKRPDARALAWCDGALSYGELIGRVEALADTLAGLGVRGETVVGVRMQRGGELVIALLAVLRAGGAYLPLDVGVPPERAAYMLGNSGVRLLLTTDDLRGDVAFPGLEVMVPPQRADGVAAASVAAACEGAQLAYVLYTSGSTGKPKGVQIARSAFANAIAAFGELLQAGERDVFLSVTGISFDIFGLELMLPLATGGTLLLAERDRLLEPGYLVDLGRRHGATLFQATPSLARNMLDSGWRPHADLRVLIGGEALTPELAAQLHAARAVFNVYGPTEATIWASAHRVRAEDESTPAPIGRAIANTELLVLDAMLEAVPCGGTGELYIAGVQLARSYASRPDLTAECFVPHPTRAGERLYRTGDLARLREDGSIDFLGRVDRQIKLRGHRIEPGEIDSVLAAHEAVSNVVTVLREDRAGDAKLVAYYTIKPEWLDRAPDPALIAARTAAWRDIYDDRYKEEGRNADQGDASVWIDTRSGRPYSPAAMREWIATTVERISGLEGKRILEIGCGSGQLLLPLAPRARSYVGTDVSRAALDSLASTTAYWPQVTLHHLAADQVRTLPPGAFDLVVINSVVQYFPSAAYLDDVVSQVAELLAPGGRLFIGDVRNKALLPIFHEAVERQRIGPVDPQRLADRDRDRQDKELCLQPAFFAQLASRHGFASAQVLARRGACDTEMNHYRFDAVLRLAPAGHASHAPAPRALAWDALCWDAEHLCTLLANEPEPLLLRGLPDPRLSLDGRGLHPDLVVELAARAGWKALVGASSPAARYDALLLPAHCACEAYSLVAPAAGRELATRPLEHEMLRQLEDGLRSHAARQLPGYMVPSLLVAMERFPLTTSGKLDRAALPRPAAAPEFHDEASGDEVEARIVQAMAEVLALPGPPGLHSDFFKLGGHSLAAVRLAARLQERFGAAASLHAVFEHRTASALAARLRLAGAGAGAPVADGGLARDVPPGTQVPLAAAQSALWFLDRLDGASALYNMACAVRIHGRVGLAALEDALTALVERHVVLRTVYAEQHGQPVGIVRANGRFRLTVETLAGELQSAIDARARVPFDLAHDCMLRACLLRRGADEEALLLVVHHIAADGLSMGLLGRELAQLYEACSRGETAALPALAAHYADFAGWQREAATPAELERQLAWWRFHLQDVPTALDMPLDRPRPAQCAHQGAMAPFNLPAGTRQAVERLAAQRGCSVFSVLLAAFGALLGGLSGQPEVVVGVPAGGRGPRRFEQLVGLFANVLPLRLDAAGADSAGALIDRTAATLREALGRQDISLAGLVDHLGIERTLDRMPLVQVVFTYLELEQELCLPGLRTEALCVDMGTARFDLSLQLAPARDGGWRGAIEFDIGLYERATIERWLGHYAHLLHAMCAQPERAATELTLMDPETARRVIHGFSRGAPTTSAAQDWLQAIECQARERPGAIAVVCGGTRLDFHELELRASRIARGLLARGVGADQVVALALPRGADLLASMLGVAKVGAAFLPIDSSVPAARANDMLQDAGARLVLGAKPTGCRADIDHVALDVLVAGQPDLPLPGREVPGHAQTYVLFTSGSTGRPKGVQVTRGGLNRFVDSYSKMLSLAPEDACLAMASVAFDMFPNEVIPALARGAAVVIADRERLLDPGYLPALLTQERVTQMIATPSMLGALDASGWIPRPALRIVSGGEAISPHLARRLCAAARLWNGYGPTEATMAQAFMRLDSAEAARPPIGRPLPGNQLYVLDARLNPVPPGVTGELYIAGEQLARGYAGRPDLTAERFLPDPFGSGGRLYRTGDLARWRADGQLEHCGRADSQVKIRGQRIELGEIEAILRSMPGLAAAAVIAREQRAGEKCLVAYLVAAPEASPMDLAAVRTALASRLPPSMLPSHYVPLPRLPMTLNGKLDIRALPAPDWLEAGAGATAHAPLDPMEARIANCMAEVLGAQRPLAAGVNFFAAGGHSLSAVRLLALLRSELGIELSLRALFEDATPAGVALAACIVDCVTAAEGAA